MLIQEVFEKGVFSKPLTTKETNDFFNVGTRIMTEEGMEAFYQGIDISQKLQD